MTTNHRWRAFAVLAWCACRSAVEAGRVRLVADPVHDGLRALGFADRSGSLEAAHDALRPPVF